LNFKKNSNLIFAQNKFLKGMKEKEDVITHASALHIVLGGGFS
jgi:hypothetical protein